MAFLLKGKFIVANHFLIKQVLYSVGYQQAGVSFLDFTAQKELPKFDCNSNIEVVLFQRWKEIRTKGLLKERVRQLTECDTLLYKSEDAYKDNWVSQS